MSPEVDLVRKKMARGVHVHRVVKSESSNHLVSPPPPFCSLPEEMHEWGALAATRIWSVAQTGNHRREEEVSRPRCTLGTERALRSPRDRHALSGKKECSRAGWGKRGVEVLSMNKGDGDLVNFRSYESTTYKYLCRKMETTDQADVRPTHRLAGWLSVWPVAEKHVAERDGELWEGCKEVGEEEEEFGPRRLFTDGTCHRFKIFHGGTY